MSVTLAASVAGGAPRVRVATAEGRPLVAVAWGETDLNFSGLDGDALELLGPWLVNHFSGRLARILRDIAADEIARLSDAIFRNAGDDENDGHATLGHTFWVPRPDGRRFAVVSQVTTSSAQADEHGVRLGLGTRFHAASPARISRSGLVPVSAASTVETGQNVRASVHPGVPAQALYALWTAGYFDGGFTNGAGTITATTQLPPVVSVPRAGRLRIAMGGVEARAELRGVGQLLRVVGDVTVEASVRRSPDGTLTLVRPDVEIRVVAPDEQIPQAQIERATALLELYLLGELTMALGNLPVTPVLALPLPESVPAQSARIEVTDVQIARGAVIALDGRFVVQ